MNTNNIIDSLNDFNKVIESKFKNGKFGLLTTAEDFKEAIYFRKYSWKLVYKNFTTSKVTVIKEFTHMVPINKLKVNEVNEAMTNQLLIFIYGFLLTYYNN